MFTRDCLLPLLFFLAIAASVEAQTQIVPRKKEMRLYEGFYASGGIGTVSGVITDKLSYYTFPFRYSGTGFMYDLRVGTAVNQELIVTGDITNRLNIVNSATMNGKSYQTKHDVLLGERSYAVGLTYFLLPSNIYAGASIGFGAFSYVDLETSESGSSRIGLSGSLRAGKFWWSGKKWALGGGLLYMFTDCVTRINHDTEELKSARVGINFQVAYN